MNDGTGKLSAKMYRNQYGEIIPSKIHAGGSIGMHRADDINYIISGIGKAICDGEEPFSAGCCHIYQKRVW